MSAAPWFDESAKYIGLKEIAGSRHEAEILRFFADSGHPEITNDETAWCAAFVGAMLVRSGYKGTGSLTARSYEKFGEKLSQPKPGCIVVMKRGNSSWQGHVTFFVKKLANGRILCRGGNQSNKVNEASYSTDKVLAYRWPVKRVKPLVKSKIAQSATAVGLTEAADAGFQVNDAIDKVAMAKDATDGLGLTDTLMQLAQNPRFWVAVAVVLVCAGIIYWRWRDHGNA